LIHERSDMQAPLDIAESSPSELARRAPGRPDVGR
jgi:hypothetical protein